MDNPRPMMSRRRIDFRFSVLGPHREWRRGIEGVGGLEGAGDHSEIADQVFEAGGAGFFVRSAEKCGGMNGDHGLLTRRRRAECGRPSASLSMR